MERRATFIQGGTSKIIRRAEFEKDPRRLGKEFFVD